MEIRKVYKTSKGTFESKEKAKVNRAKVNCSDGRGGWWSEKEEIVEIWVLIPDWDFDGDWDFSMPGAFILTPVNIRLSKDKGRDNK